MRMPTNPSCEYFLFVSIWFDLVDAYRDSETFFRGRDGLVGGGGGGGGVGFGID